MQERIHDALRRNAVDEALALAQEWAAQAPDDASAQRSLSAALARAGDPAAALVALDGDGRPVPAAEFVRMFIRPPRLAAG